MTPPIPLRVQERVMSRVVMGERCCWVSTYSTSSHGYAQVGWTEGGRTYTTTAHRAAYTSAHGPVPNGLVVDHFCHNRRCVNPSHLQVVTNEVNARRQPGYDFAVCKRGHPRAAHTYVAPDGRRRCSACRLENTRAWRAKKSAF